MSEEFNLSEKINKNYEIHNIDVRFVKEFIRKITDKLVNKSEVEYVKKLAGENLK